MGLALEVAERHQVEQRAGSPTSAAERQAALSPSPSQACRPARRVTPAGERSRLATSFRSATELFERRTWLLIETNRLVFAQLRAFWLGATRLTENQGCRLCGTGWGFASQRRLRIHQAWRTVGQATMPDIAAAGWGGKETRRGEGDTLTAQVHDDPRAGLPADWECASLQAPRRAPAAQLSQPAGQTGTGRTGDMRWQRGAGLPGQWQIHPGHLCTAPAATRIAHCVSNQVTPFPGWDIFCQAQFLGPTSGNTDWHSHRHLFRTPLAAC